MDNFKVSSRLYILLSIAAAAFIILLLITEMGMKTLGELQDAGHRREAESAEMQVSAKFGSVMYQVIADSIINHNLAESARDWAAVKAEGEKLMARAKDVADTPEEKQEIEKAITAFQELIKIYEGSVVPLLNANADIKEIRPLDDEMDKQAQAIEDVLTPFAKSLNNEATKADEEFDTTRQRIIFSSLVVALLMLATMVMISVYISNSIIRQLGGEPKEAMEISRRIAAGDLTSRIVVDSAHGQNLMSSMQLMQKQLAQLITKINASASHVSMSAEQLASASQQVSVSSLQQSEDTASVAASIEQLTVSIDHVADSASQAEGIAKDSGNRSDQGALQVKEATDEMMRIAQSVNETAAQMANLAEQSQQIGSIANVIKEVADQTNLLALNAAIEAARAGEFGRGFAVVADEVRKLAERTTASAQEISIMTASIQEHSDKATITMRQGNERVAEGVVIAQRAGDSMHQISEGSMGVVSAVSDISHSLKEQKIASNQIAYKVENIAQMTEENSAAVSQVASTAGQLKSMADELMQAVSGFKV